MKKLIFGVLFLIITLSACSTEEITHNQNDVTDYAPLKIGNYWVYKSYYIDPQGNETPGSYDSIFVANDTVHNGHTYKVLKKGWHEPYHIESIIRDSLSYIVNIDGHILFSSDNFTDVLYRKTLILNGDTIYVAQFKMEQTPHPVTVDAGTFDNVLNYKCNVEFYRTGHPHYSLNNYYVKNIGRILKTTMYISSQNKTEYRLVRYHIQ